MEIFYDIDGIRFVAVGLESLNVARLLDDKLDCEECDNLGDNDLECRDCEDSVKDAVDEEEISNLTDTLETEGVKLTLTEKFDLRSESALSLFDLYRYSLVINLDECKELLNITMPSLIRRIEYYEGDVVNWVKNTAGTFSKYTHSGSKKDSELNAIYRNY